MKKIVIGDFKDIKQGMDYNISIVQISIQTLAQKIEYKVKLINYINNSETSIEILIDNWRGQRLIKKRVV